MLHDLLYILLVLAIAGILLWALSAMPVIDATIKQMIRILIIVVAAIYTIYILFGMFMHHPLPMLRI